jgi:hypothetical protein
MNVFKALFGFHPQEHKTANENFLTEALAYSLKSSPAAASAWISLLTAGAVTATSNEISTRAVSREDESDRTIFPDINVNGKGLDGKYFRLIVEHKWDAGYDKKQLESYSRLITDNPKGYLAFVCAKHSDQLKAKKAGYSAYLWEDVYCCLNKVEPKTDLLSEFLEFMDHVGLSPVKPLVPSILREAAQDSKLWRKPSNPFRQQMFRICQKLSNVEDWRAIPNRYRNNRTVEDKSGRCQVVFSNDDGWRPAICLGFYYSTNDHHIAFTDLQKGIDLAIRIQACPQENQHTPTDVLKLLRQRVKPLERLGAVVHIKGDPGRSNAHTLFFAQKSLIDVIENIDDEKGQINAIHAELMRWCDALFKDNLPLVAAFAELKPYC